MKITFLITVTIVLPIILFSIGSTAFWIAYTYLSGQLADYVHAIFGAGMSFLSAVCATWGLRSLGIAGMTIT